MTPLFQGNTKIVPARLVKFLLSRVSLPISIAHNFDPSGIAINELSRDLLILPGVIVDCTKVSKREVLPADN